MAAGTVHPVAGLPAGADPKESTAAEIITATEDGMTLIYSDSPGKRIGLIDISDPKAPTAAGVVALGGEPTTTVVVGGKALVGVNTSESKVNPSGHVAIVACHNNDLANFWEWYGSPQYPLRPATDAFRIGTNVLVHSMTH